MGPSAFGAERHDRAAAAGFGDRPAGDPGRPAPQPVPRRAARHRFVEDTDHRVDDAARDDTQHITDEAAQPSEFGLRPESVGRLTDADRQLLARLQAELLDGRKVRNGRRPGAGPGTNGAHRATPPDLAG
jgi:hypothetical protein